MRDASGQFELSHCSQHGRRSLTRESKQLWHNHVARATQPCMVLMAKIRPQSAQERCTSTRQMSEPKSSQSAHPRCSDRMVFMQVVQMVRS
jgi:hypothetical protein